MTGPLFTADDQGAVLDSVAALLAHRLPGDWERLLLEVRVMGGHVESTTSLLDLHGRESDWELPEEALPLLLHLREGMADPVHGAWFALRLRLTHPGEYSAEQDWDSEPAWTHRPPERHHVEELALHPRAESEIPGWLRERAGLPEPAPVHAAPLFDGVDGQGTPTFERRPAVHPQERDDVLAYLESAPVVLPAPGDGSDALDPARSAPVPMGFHSDGTWVWAAGSAYYLREHGVPVLPQLVQHIRDNGYRVPEVDEAARERAAAVASGRTPGAPVPPHRPRGISDADQRALEHLRARLDHYGVAPGEYSIVEPKPDALVIEPAPGERGWQVQFWDASRGPQGRPVVHRHAVDAARALLGQLLWDDGQDSARAARLRDAQGPATGPVRTVAGIQPMPDEPPLSLFRDHEPVLLPAGTEVDRHGAENGNLVYAARTPNINRSLPKEFYERPYHSYRVQRPIPALRGVAVPWFEQVGGGSGFFLARSVRDFLHDGSLVEVFGPTSAPPQS
ncbi:TNT domain-containing protein [Actinosynnema mirum]|uniref:TNT domain-containing protein n=1 Tax=Actinosynnema mirum (strain ATCC 29888 / DSM 43827 / JCM 3225 / NBRC 14064 / NCIMB 13271 / NRRL B-12336 / IMRU 3971 / 101) TaxID=446462 RepID=C6WLR1_ACTMD|nr:TNT domain-containing protein [Actinosynnema mirum]ACU40296.1 hypothetical protein Amir_6495 [Actinosynnema mirum DSM 43827]